MAQKIVVFDDTTGKTSASTTTIGAVGGGFTDNDFDVGVGGQSLFLIASGFTAGQKIDVWVNGRKQREGATYDFVRNVGPKTITLNYTIPQNAWVSIRIYS